MKPTLAAVLFAAALSLPAAAAHAIDSKAAGSGASSVADMQLRMQDTKLRAQLVREGRWEEIRKMDEVTAQRLQAQHDHRYVQTNEQLAHTAGPEGQIIDARAMDCDPDAMHVR
jgi:hypothetical protein